MRWAFVVFVFAVLLASVGVAGCLGDERPTPAAGSDGAPEDGGTLTENWPARALPDSQRHAHADPAQHENLSTPNFDLEGYTPLATDYHDATSGSYACGGTGAREGREFVAVQSFSTDVAFVMADVTDPTDPRKVGELALPTTHVWGIEMTPDARFVLLATSPFDDGPDQTPSSAEPAAAGPRDRSGPTWTDACGDTRPAIEDPLPYASGVVLVDVRDPSQPEVVDYVPEPVQGAHTVHARTIDGTTVVLAGIAHQAAHAASHFSFFTLEETTAGPQLVPYGEYHSAWPGPSPAARQPPVGNGHLDGWIQQHPGTGDTLAYLANWNGGIRIVRLDGPGRIQEVGRWTDWDPSAGDNMVGNWHTVQPATTEWNGTHYTVVGQEVTARPAERPTGQVLLLDTTDPSRPEPVARWTLPADVAWSGRLQFTTHYVEMNESARRLFVATAHAGLWAVDLDRESAADGQLDPLGVYVPARVPPQPQPGTIGGRPSPAPIVSDVWSIGEGRLAIADGPSGLYTLDFHANVSVPEPSPWTGDGWQAPEG